MTTRRIAMLYLPTVGLWSLRQAVRFYRQDKHYHGHRRLYLRLLDRLL